MEIDRAQNHESILLEFTQKPNSEFKLTSQLHKANAIQQKCAKVGFDWPDVALVFNKIIEELDEVKEAIANPSKNKDDVTEELGDLLFACVNLCRHLQVHPDEAITGANEKFIKRFQQIEAILQSEGANVEDQTPQNLEALWQKVKIST